MGNAMNKEPDWIPLMDYAMRYGVSLSTLRRHIKANKIQYKVENGRYLLRSPYSTEVAAAPILTAGAPGAPVASGLSAVEAHDLRLRLQRAQEEISELKMLIALYEEQLSQSRPGQLGMNAY